jgi:hypothetical protein
MKDLHNTVAYSQALAPVAAVTNDTAFVSNILDTDNALAVEFIGVLGAVADADVAFTVLVEDGDNAALSDNAAVADANLIGVEAGTVTSGATVSGAAPGYADDNKTFKIGYKGTKRYVRVTVTPANNTGNIFLAAIWAKYMRSVPQSTQVA